MAGVGALAFLAPAKAAHPVRLVQPPAAAYTYGGIVYDRLFSILSRPRMQSVPRVPLRDARIRSSALATYAITDLTPIAGEAVFGGTIDGFGYPTAVNNAGLITYFDQCGCAGSDGNIALLLNDDGSYTRVLFENQSQEGVDNAIPSAINSTGNSVGEETQLLPGSSHEHVIAWSVGGAILYRSGASDITYGLAINDANVSVGHDTGAKGSFAALFSVDAQGNTNRVLLAPPKNVSWIGTATGINNAGTIVGYATFPGGGRAVKFLQGSNAVVLPVATAGISTSAQAINQHGDVVGNAGNRAFLYRNNRVTYLPAPPGEAAGNAVAYAINAADQIVGDIATGPGTSTAFLYSGGQAYDLNALLPANSGWRIVHASGINDAGQIVGVGYFAGEGGALSGFSMKLQPNAGSVTLYSKGLHAQPHDITLGLDGNLWFTEVASGGGRVSIGKITHDGVVTEYTNGIVHLDPPGGITSGSDGNMWFAGNNRIGKITPAGAVTEYTAGISADADPKSLVAGPDGNLWFVESKLTRIGKITTGGVVTEYAKGIPDSGGENGPYSIAPGPDGNLWFTEIGVTNNWVGKITPSGNVTAYVLPPTTADFVPLYLTTGSDKNLWVASYARGQAQPAIAKVTTTGVVTEYPAGVTGVTDKRPLGITAGPDGNVWYTESDDSASNQICKMTPAGAATCYALDATAGGISDGGKIANGNDGYLWFTTGRATIGKIHS